ncbi:hypothetical protein [Peribacillus sp. N1]
MKLSNSYPYPVLHPNNDDYSNSSFQVEFVTEKVFGEFKIHAFFSLQNEGIEQLIQAGNAVYMLRVECPQTSFRKAYFNAKPEIHESIDTKHLRGKVNIHSFIIAQREITHYNNKSLNDWYKGIKIMFERGNLLAIGNAIEATLHEDNTELMDLPAIIDVHRGINKEYMEVEINSQIILVSLPEEEYDHYASYANTRLKSTIISMIFLPCLMEVFTRMKDDREEDLVEYTWYQVMEKIFKENNLQIEDVGTDRLPALKAAQLILRKPLKLSFKEIEKIALED